jgi:malonyl-CoA O-methyltransferase
MAIRRRLARLASRVAGRLQDPVPVLDPAAAYALWASDYPAHAHNPVMKLEESAVRQLLPADLRGRTVLDAGCGTGRYLAEAARRGATSIVGVDISHEMLTRARPSAGSLVRGDVTAIPVRDGWADLTVSGLTVGHVPSLADALREMSRVTRRGGTIVCSDFHPIAHALGGRRELTVNGTRFAVRHTQHLYGAWHAACASLGLEIVRVLEPFLDRAQIPADFPAPDAILTHPMIIALQIQRP